MEAGWNTGCVCVLFCAFILNANTVVSFVKSVETESDVSTVEPLQEIQTEKQHHISTETSPEVPEVIPESACSLDKPPALESIADTGTPSSSPVSLCRHVVQNQNKNKKMGDKNVAPND